jgi:GNAT superfamily N-acetyltransferase
MAHDEINVRQLSSKWIRNASQLEARAYSWLHHQFGGADKPERKTEMLSVYIENYSKGSKAAFINETLVGFGIARKWGILGWIGSVVVEPEYHGRGVGHALVESMIQTLRADGCSTIALEVHHYCPNIQFYIRLGFIPVAPVFILERKVKAPNFCLEGRLVSHIPTLEYGPEGYRELNRANTIKGLQKYSNAIYDGLDYSPAAEAMLNSGFGEVIIWGDEDDPWAAAIIPTKEQFEGPASSSLNVTLLTLRTGELSQADPCILADLAVMADRAGRRSIRLALCGCRSNELSTLVNMCNFRIVKTRLRMVMQDNPVEPISMDYVLYGI